MGRTKLAKDESEVNARWVADGDASHGWGGCPERKESGRGRSAGSPRSGERGYEGSLPDRHIAA